MLAREPNEEISALLWIFLCLYKHTVTTWILLSCIFVKLLIAKNGAIPSKVKLETDLLPAVYALVSNVTNLFWFEINGIWTYGVMITLKKNLLWNNLIIKHCCIILSTLLNLYRINLILTKQSCLIIGSVSDDWHELNHYNQLNTAVWWMESDG